MRPRYNRSVPLPLLARLPRVTDDLRRALNEPGESLTSAALAIAGVEYPALDAAPYLLRLERMGEAAAGRLQRHEGAPASIRLATLNAYLYEELGFSGNRDHYDDPRNSLLNEVDCRHLLRQHVGEEAAFDHGLLATATRQHIVVRMLVNLKRLYVRMRSFPQARAIADLLLAVDPSALAELRDRGLLAYHMEDFAAALRDLEAYLRLMPRGAADEEQEMESGDADEQPASESAQIWEHVKTLRRRVAGFN